MNCITDLFERWFFGQELCKCGHKRWQHFIHGVNIECFAKDEYNNKTGYVICKCVEFKRVV